MKIFSTLKLEEKSNNEFCSVKICFIFYSNDSFGHFIRFLFEPYIYCYAFLIYLKSVRQCSQREKNQNCSQIPNYCNYLNIGKLQMIRKKSFRFAQIQK